MTWRIDRKGQPAIPIASGDTVIGSGDRTDLRIAGAEPRHAMLRVVAGRLFIESIDDAPFWINGREQTKAFLNAGDKIQMSSGGDELILAKGDAPVPVVVPPPIPLATKKPAAPPFELVQDELILLDQPTAPFSGANQIVRTANTKTPIALIMAGAMTPLLLIAIYLAIATRSTAKITSAAPVVLKAEIPKEDAPVHKIEPQKSEPQISVVPAAQPQASVSSLLEAMPQTPPPDVAVKPPDPPAVHAVDPFPANSEWTNDILKMTLSVTRRDGDAFQGKFRVGNAVSREVSGLFTDGTVRWPAKQNRNARGSGEQYEGRFAEGDQGNEIDFEWSSGTVFGSFTLQRSK